MVPIESSPSLAIARLQNKVQFTSMKSLQFFLFQQDHYDDSANKLQQISNKYTVTSHEFKNEKNPKILNILCINHLSVSRKCIMI